MAEKTLDTLCYDILKDVCCAEKKIVKALPEMVFGAQSPELKVA